LIEYYVCENGEKYCKQVFQKILKCTTIHTVIDKTWKYAHIWTVFFCHTVTAVRQAKHKQNCQRRVMT